MKKLKLFTLVGTRPELIKLSATIALADLFFDQHLVHTGQNHDFELNELIAQQLGIRTPDLFLNCAGGGTAQTIAKVIERTDAALEAFGPDAFLILGDTNSCLGAISAKKRQIPIFHMEAGNRCFDQRVPEEVNRKLIDHLSDINLPYTEFARSSLLAEGMPTNRIIKTGSPMAEVLAANRSQIDASSILEQLNIVARSFFLVSAHRQENIDDPIRLSALIASLNHVAEVWKMPILVSTHPRLRRRLEEARGLSPSSQIRFLAPFGFHEFCRLQTQATCVISDSGTLTEEAALLGFPAVMIRDAHERPEGVEEAVAVRSDITPLQINNAISLAVASKRKPNLPPDYMATNVSEKVVNVIASYTEVINREVWHKQSVD
jgi:UDP-N-acetylglucosamine 2-epimerase